MKLSDREWKDFSVPYIFQKIQRGKRLKNADHISGIIPYVSSTANNNGVDDYIEAIDGTRVFENCISLANSGSVGTAFYEPFAFVASDHVTSLKRENTSQYVYLFLTAVLEQQGSNFNFNREINDLRIRKMRVMLPVDDNDEPDYQFMEDYMKELMTAKRKQYQEYVEHRLVKLGVDDMKNTERGGYNLDLESREWKPCRLSKLGKVESGRDIYAMERVEGDIPYITSGSQNNGIGYFVSNKNDTFDKDYIAFNRNGAVGLAFYHPYWSVMGNDCRKIHISKADENMYVGLFIATAISMQSKSFSYSRKLGTARANKLQIMLPVDDNNEPDYEFMEECGRKIMAKKYIQYLKYLESTCESSDLLLK